MSNFANVINQKIKPLVIDNFLEKQTFQEMKNHMFGLNFNWFYNNSIDFADDLNKFQFTHTFYRENVGVNSEDYSILSSIIAKLNIKNTIRIKANLLTKTFDIVKNKLHVDVYNQLMKHINENEPFLNYKTAIFYMNTNNGYTEFEDGSIVESVENRMVIFPSEISHRGTSCTDENVRVVINFNYIDIENG